MPRYPSRYAGTSSFSFGPGPISTAFKAIIGANVAVFLAMCVMPPDWDRILVEMLGLVPFHVVRNMWIWQLATYMFVHATVFHILFNMLALWMFGMTLEQDWGTRRFLKYYFLCGIGAGICDVALNGIMGNWGTHTIGASGAIYGLLLAYALYFPDRPILMIVFWVPAKVCVAILGAIALVSSLSDAGGVANATHLGGLLVAYLFLKGARLHPMSEVKYRYLKWKINRVRKKFDVYSGGRADDYDRRVH
jgi:membrane associated rhomboid family serine protease